MIDEAQWVYKRLPLTVKAIVNEVAADMEVDVDELLGRSARPAHVQARQLLYWRIRQLILPNGKHPSMPLIGKWLARDHSTVVWGINRHADRVAKDPAFAEYCKRFAAPETKKLRVSKHLGKSKFELLNYIDYLEGEIARITGNAEARTPSTEGHTGGG